MKGMGAQGLEGGGESDEERGKNKRQMEKGKNKSMRESRKSILRGGHVLQTCAVFPLNSPL